MRRVSLLVALLASPALAQQAPARPFEFTIRNIMRGPELYGRPPANVRWSADGKWIYFSWLEPGTDWRETLKPFRVRAVPGAKPERVSLAHADSAGAIVARGPLSTDRRSMAVAYNGDIYINDLQRNGTRRLTQTVAQESSPEFSADSKRVYFVRDNNVFSVDLDGGFLRQLTDIRSGPAPTDSARAAGQRGRLEEQQTGLFEAVRDRLRADSIAKADQKAREALGLRTHYLNRGEQVAGLSISPNGRSLLISTRNPPQNVRQTEVPSFVTRSGYTEQLRVRDKVGDTQNAGRIGYVSLPAGDIKWIKATVSDTTAAFVDAPVWTPAGDRALFYTFASDNKVRLLQVLDAQTGTARVVDTVRDSAWVGGPCVDCGGWYANGSRMWFVSEADGFAHLYTADASGGDRRQLTRGRFEILNVELSRDQRTFFIHANQVSPFEEHFYRLPVDGGAMEKITARQGRHRITVSPDEQWGADVYSYVNRPPELFLTRLRPGSEMSQLTLSPTADWLSFKWTEPEIVMIPASDGAKVPAHIYRPSDMGAQPNGAAVIFVHGAGYLHNVGMFWSEYPREYMFNHYLASKGYVVLDLDFRASSGYGRDWRTGIYRFMGGRDLQDQVDASKYLQKNFSIHPERVGLYGGSYGGFITLMALFTEAKQFGAGAALRSVTDWAHYNHGYTSNILNSPQTDTLAFRRSSPIYFAEGLEDPLLMAHGMVDTNVHFQDIVRLSQRLIELGKTDWELAAYPVEDHAFVRPSSWYDEYRRIFELFERWLPARVPLRSPTPR